VSASAAGPLHLRPRPTGSSGRLRTRPAAPRTALDSVAPAARIGGRRRKSMDDDANRRSIGESAALHWIPGAVAVPPPSSLPLSSLLPSPPPFFPVRSRCRAASDRREGNTSQRQVRGSASSMEVVLGFMCSFRDGDAPFAPVWQGSGRSNKP
jgi:hypothetical protein